MKLPRLFAACDDCWENAPEQGCHYPQSIGWSFMHQKWLCTECWDDFDTTYPDKPLIHTTPLVCVDDLLPTEEEQMQRLAAEVAKQRMGVK